MTSAYVQYTQLDADRLKKIQSLEKELGSWIVAVEPQARMADLKPDQVQRLRQAEDELGVILLAYRPA